MCVPWLSAFLKAQSSSPQTGRQVGAVAIWPASLHLACPLQSPGPALSWTSRAPGLLSALSPEVSLT